MLPELILGKKKKSGNMKEGFIMFDYVENSFVWEW